jgi:glycosyltransferase 2 family protein
MSSLPNKTIKAKTQLLIRIVGSISLILWILHMIEWDKMLEVVRKGSMPYFIAAFLAIQVTVASSVWKWKLLVDSSLTKIERENASLNKLGRFYYIGLFFNNFLPGSVGGDVVRIYYLGRITGIPSAAASVAFERLTSGFALIGIAVVSIFSVKTSKSVVLSVLLITGVCVILFIAAGKWMRKAKMKESEQTKENPTRMRKMLILVKGSLEKMISTAETYRRNGLKWWLLIGVLSILFQVGLAWINQLLFLSLGIDLPWLELLMIITLISVITMLPVSVNGLGVREGCYIFFFNELGVPSEIAVSVSLLFFFLVTLSSLAGGLFWMSERGRNNEAIRKQVH